jgi:hypothetical protein
MSVRTHPGLGLVTAEKEGRKEGRRGAEDRCMHPRDADTDGDGDGDDDDDDDDDRN